MLILLGHQAGVAVYSSEDLSTWEHHGLALGESHAFGPLMQNIPARKY